MNLEEFKKEHRDTIDKAVKLYQEGDRIESARLISKIIEIRMKQVAEDYMRDVLGMEVNFGEDSNEN